MRAPGVAFLMLFAAALASCAAPQRPKPGVGPLVRLGPSELPSFRYNKDPIALAGAVENSIRYYEKLPPDAKVSFGREAYSASVMREDLVEFREFLLSGPSEALLSDYIRKRMDVYASAGYDGRGAVLFTGYYLPEIRAKRSPDATYRFPVYALPGDVVTADLGLFKEGYKGERVVGRVEGGALVPYYTRRDIDAGKALEGRGLELAWCRDPADVFFLQVQGSGILDLGDGSKAHVNYAGSNGRAYRSIGRLLIERGLATRGEMSMEFLRGFLAAHPEDAAKIMEENESYVFFRLEDSGPYGCLGVPVTPECSVATDNGVFPPGALVFIVTEAPERSEGGGVSGWAPYSGLFMNQDTGGAIKGPGRVDVYFGSGDYARFRAGFMNRGGRLYFLAGKRSGRGKLITK